VGLKRFGETLAAACGECVMAWPGRHFLRSLTLFFGTGIFDK